MTDLISAGILLLREKNLNEVGEIIISMNGISEDTSDLKSIQNALWLLLGPASTEIRKIIENTPKNQIKNCADALSTPDTDFRCLQDFDQLIKKTQQDSTISTQSKNVRLSFLGKLREELLKTRPSLQSTKPPKPA